MNFWAEFLNNPMTGVKQTKLGKLKTNMAVLDVKEGLSSCQ